LTTYGSPLETGQERPGERAVKLGRYEIVRELGKGAMGVVYLAKDPLIGRLVALKTIRAARGDDDETREFQQRFIREAQAAGILNHPAIVTVHDIGQDEPSGTNFISMEYVEGQNLKEILAQGRPLSFDEIGDIAAQVAEALDFAHAKGIVHRDVKPANIIVLEGNRAKITDFGIAKIASGGNLTTTGQFLGTPNYMAPEQIRGAPVDGRTDIFSLGICLYECLTRRKPFGGESLTSISYKIVHEPFPPLHEINPQIPDGYGEVVALCLAKDPAKRYQRGRDLAIALRQVIRGERPAKREPMLEEQTIVTRDHDKLPTIEMPFPEAAAGAIHSNPHSTMSAAAVAGGGAAAAVMPQPAARPVSLPRPKPGEVVRKTLDSVRAMPLWKATIPSAVFFSLIGFAIVALVIMVASIRSRATSIPIVDTAAEARAAKTRQLRNQANDLLHDGNVAEATKKFEELGKLAPKSPYVLGVNTKLTELRRQSESKQQQLVQAKQFFDQGMVLFNNKQYADAVKAFDESFHLNPNSDEAANYLKLAQQEDERVRTEQAHANPQLKSVAKPTVTPTTTRGGQTRRATSGTGLASITTTFAGQVNDGYIMVRIGGDVVAHENLWQETGRFLLRRRVPRDVNVSKEITPKSADVDVWVVIPSMSIQEHHTIRANFAPGTAHHLIVSFDPQNKTFAYQMN
jgi:serine/threonine protein kinase/outer membrane protein assembly factor BamD (BamD/ComL family)